MTPPVQKLSGVILRKTLYDLGCVPRAIFYFKCEDNLVGNIFKVKKSSFLGYWSHLSCSNILIKFWSLHYRCWGRRLLEVWSWRGWWVNWREVLIYFWCQFFRQCCLWCYSSSSCLSVRLSPPLIFLFNFNDRLKPSWSLLLFCPPHPFPSPAQLCVYRNPDATSCTTWSHSWSHCTFKQWSIYINDYILSHCFFFLLLLAYYFFRRFFFRVEFIVDLVEDVILLHPV